MQIELFEPRFMMHGGVDHGTSGHVDLADLLPSGGGDGDEGVVVSGSVAGGTLGRSVKSAGDVNGDGIEDLIIGAPAVGSSAGAAYVVFGKASAFSATINLSSLNGTNGFQITGSSGEQAGYSVSSAGDVNHDGFDDLVIGAPTSDPSGRTDAGAAYVVFGRNSFAATVTLASLNGTTGFRLNGVTAGDAAGTSVAAAGDVNNDGFADFIIGATGADPSSRSGAGSAYVVFGKSSFTSVVELSSLNGTSGFRLDGAAAGDEFGFSVSTAGDVNKDGFADLIVGAPGADPSSKSQAGSTYVVFGKASFTASADVSTLNGTTGFRLDGVAADDRSGYSVSGDGDVNNDGFADILIGAPRAKVDGVSIGAAYVFYGKASGYAASTSLAALNGTLGFRLAGDYESDPLLNSFIVNTTGKMSHAVPGQNTTLVANALVNFTSVIPDDTSVYVHSSGIPAAVIGPWPSNPNTVTDKDRTHKIPRFPTVETGTKRATTLGSTGVWIDGVAVFNWADGMSYNNGGVWNQNAVYFEGPSLDSYGGHPPPDGEYHTHAAPAGLMTTVGDNGSGHSPILGWSYDGYPIYGPWGYANADGSGGVERQETSWQVRNITTRTTYANGTAVAAGPTVATTPLGAYIEDFEYVAGLGDLDRYNGRFSVTPEYPEGLYHYVVTIDSAGKGAFPYAIGLEYNGVVETANFGTATGGGTGGGGTIPPPPPGGGGGTPPPPGGGGGGVLTINVGTPSAADIDVSFAGDFNGDGIDDILVGDPDAYVSGANVAGAAYAVYGKSSFPADTHLHTLSGTNGFEINGIKHLDHAGDSVGAVDLNGDGASDLVIGVSGATSSAGQSFVLFGISVAGSAGVTVTPSGGSTIVNENGTTDTLSVALNSQPTANVVIAVSSGNTAEVTASPVSVTFTPANWNVAQTVTVTGVADGVVDADKNTFITFDPSSIDAAYNALASAQASVTNQNVDIATPAGITVTASGGSTIVTELGTTDTLSVVLNSQPTANVVIAVTSGNTAEVTVSPAAITFTPANWNIAQTVTVTGVADGIVDADKNTFITFDPSSTDTAYNALANVQAAVTNQNVDIATPAGITVTASGGSTIVTELGTTDTLSVVLNSQPTANVVISVTSGNTAEVTVSPASITFTPANWNIAQTVTVTGVADGIVDADKNTFIMFDPSSTDAAYNALANVQAAVTNQNVDVATPAGITVTASGGSTIVTELGTIDTLSIVLNNQPTANVVISVTSGNTAEVTVSPASITFTPANWNIAQTVTVTGVADGIVDADKDTFITFDPSSADAAYNALANVQAVVTNQNVDVATPAGITVTAAGGSTIVNESGTTDTLSVVLNSQPTANVVIAVTSGNTAEVTVSPASLTFTPANWNVAQAVTVTGVADSVVDADKDTFITFDPSSTDTAYNALASFEATATNLNRDYTFIPTLTTTPNSLSGSHVIGGNTLPTAYVFRAAESSTLSVTSTDLASETAAIHIVNSSLQLLNQVVGGIVTASMSAGELYAIIFDAKSTEQTFSISSSGGAQSLSTDAHTNILKPTDTNGDGNTTAADALIVINQMNRDVLAAASGSVTTLFGFTDVNRDGTTTAGDALDIIKELNRLDTNASPQSEGESTVTALLPTVSKLSIATSRDAEPSPTNLEGASTPLGSDSSAIDVQPLLVDFAANDSFFSQFSEDSEDDDSVDLLATDAIKLLDVR